MKCLIQILCLPELHPLPVMKCVFEELSTAFQDHHCSIKTVYNMSDIEDGGIVFLDDAAGNYKNNITVYHQIHERCPNGIYICWYWKDMSFRPFQRMIHTGEYYMCLDPRNDHYEYMSDPEFVPLLLRASDSPKIIGEYPRQPIRDYCFMGGGYKMDWVPPQFTGLYHRVIWDNYLSYQERRSIYLSSTFAFAFQSDHNIEFSHLSQRIFEGLAYGCIVLCENKLAATYTDEIVVHVTSKEDLVEKMEYYKTYPEEVQKKQQAAYEWVKKHGTNRTSAQRFMDAINERFNERFDKPVVSVNIMGGLGNQLFQLAAAYSYARKNNATLMIQNKRDNGNRPFYWDTFLSTIKPFLVDTLPSLKQWSEDLPTMYKPLPPIDHQGLYLNGYLQTSKYFLKNEIRESFTPVVSSELLKKYNYILTNKKHVIVMHARQTDYLLHRDFHGPVDHTYYRRALHKMTEYVQHPFIVLCGDDNEFWKDMEIEYPHVILEDTDVNTFAILQQFENFIMSNSTFIWWCVWLSTAKHVIVPKNWFGPTGPHPYEDIYESSWERM